jgi:cytoskeletal protein CcmA (bactofilin family)
MDLLKSEPWGSWEGGNCESQPTQSVETVESATTGTRNGVEVQPVQWETLSIGIDGNCCVLKNCNFSGKLRFEGAVRIECQVAGEIQGTDIITVAEGAFVTGPLRAASVVIEGRVNTDVIASKRIEIRPSATVFGNLTAPAMMVHERAKVEGRFSMNNGRQGSGS